MTARIVVTTALALMMLTSSAWAECGWVLWGQVRSTSSWEVIQSFKSKDACEGSRQVQVMREDVTRHLCLPDTIDPRGPKGTTP